MFPTHCVRGTAECEILPELTEFEGEVIPKQRFSCFYGTSLQKRLLELQPEKLIVVGVCTDICVMHTVADARDRGYAVEVPRDCVATFDAEAHVFALKHMEKVLGTEIV
jgi:nicotinamidase-related amidase